MALLLGLLTKKDGEMIGMIRIEEEEEDGMSNKTKDRFTSRNQNAKCKAFFTIFCLMFDSREL